MSTAELERGGRFVFHERLGAGATGSVFRAYDKTREATVAVKVLTQVDPSSLYRFKAEFRALTGISHPHLVQLYDLLMRDGEWLLTMELVEGGDFLRYVRPAEALVGASTPEPEPDEATLDTDAFDDSMRPPPARTSLVQNDNANARSSTPFTRRSVPFQQGLGTLDEPRLRSALRQLCEGLDALHRSNRLHRDLKPANVLVFARDGRVVICDFGLVTDSTRVHSGKDGEHGVGIAGTLAYMSPEQATGQMLTEASDWYAVGVMLYQALTGVLPFGARFSVRDAIAAKQQGVAVHPCSVALEAPEDLADLALALLAPEPAERPRFSQIIALLAGLKRRPSLGPSAPLSLVGRGLQLEQLQDALARARAGLATVVMVGGRSGMGKSALIQHFLDEVRHQERGVVLAGRCYEREELPFKAFDPVMDALSTYLLSLDVASARELMPPNISALARLFPVLRRVPAITSAMGREVVDPLEQKRRAFTAFRALCRNISLRRPLVLYIDDLQWGDLDSGPLFAELLHPPQPPALLVVCAFRSEDEDVSVLLKALRTTHLPEAGIEPVEVRIDALSIEESRELALTVLGDAPEAEACAERVAAEGGGSPFFVRELALYLRERGGLADGELRLETLIAQRLSALPSESRLLFSLIAASGRPETRAVLLLAAKLGELGFAALRLLEAKNLVHSSGTGSGDRLEAYHDRLRETAYRLLGEDERKRLHRQLAEALEQRGERDAEALYEHWRASAEPHKAGSYALEAAHKAESQLAFERASKLYRAALALVELDPEQLRSFEERLGHCLAFAGRGAEAAACFTRALVGASPAQSMQLRSLATTQLLRAGRIEQAYDELRSAKELIGLSVPATQLSAILMLLWRRLKIRFRKVRLRAHARLPAPELLQRADMLWGVSASLTGMDNLRGAVYQSEHLLVALQANDPYRLARAMAGEATMSATRNQDPGRTQLFIDRGLEVGGMSGNPHAISVVKGTAGICRLLEGRFREAVQLTREAQEIIRERLNATLAWDLVTMLMFDLQATAYLGNVREIVARVPEALRDADARGDFYAAISLRTRRCIWAWLGPDQLETARRQVEIAETQWTQQGYHLQHWYITHARAELDLYGESPEASLLRLEGEWKKLTFLRKIQYTRIEAWYLRGRLSLACARRKFTPALLASARADARAIEGEGTHWGAALSHLLLACAASFDDLGRALVLLRELEGQFDALDMRLHHECVRYRRGQMMGNEEGHALVEQADIAIRVLGITRPDAFVALLAPGFPGIAAPLRGSVVAEALAMRTSLVEPGSSVDMRGRSMKTSEPEMRS